MGLMQSELHDAAYALLYRVMQQEHNCTMEMLDLQVTKEGKPYFKDSLWQFSICHTDGLVLVAVSDFSVGIDAEKSDRRISNRVANRFLKLPACTVKEWTQYESLGKMIGCGIPFTKEDLGSTRYFSKFYSDLIGYTVCVTCVEASFSESIKMF